MFHAPATKKLGIVALAASLAITSLYSPALAAGADYSVFYNLNIPGLTASQCVATDASDNIVSTGAACNAGTVTAVTGSGNILSSGGTTPNITTVTSPSFSGTVTAGQVIDSGLTASQGVSTNGSSQLISSGEGAPTTYISGTRAGGLHIEIFQLTASATTPWEATGTFGHTYTVAPFCTTTIINATPLYSGADIVSESTTTVVIYDSSQQGYKYNVQCIGF